MKDSTAWTIVSFVWVFALLASLTKHLFIAAPLLLALACLGCIVAAHRAHTREVDRAIEAAKNAHPCGE